MTQPTLDFTPRQIADTSREAFAAIRQDLPRRDLDWCLRVAVQCDRCGLPDVTAGELAACYDEPITSVRPRLTGAYRAGWLTKGPARKTPFERWAHGYRLAVPREAVERAIREAKGPTETPLVNIVKNGTSRLTAQGEGDTFPAVSTTGRPSDESPNQPDLTALDRLRLSRSAQGVAQSTAPRFPDTT